MWERIAHALYIKICMIRGGELVAPGGKEAVWLKGEELLAQNFEKQKYRKMEERYDSKRGVKINVIDELYNMV